MDKKPPHDALDPRLSGLLSMYEHRFRRGDLRAVGSAIGLCGLNGLPLPEWCVAPALEGLDLLASTGKRGKSPPAKKYEQARRDDNRHMLVSMILQAPLDWTGKARVTLDEACEIVANEICKSENVTARAVKETYRKIERTLK